MYTSSILTKLDQEYLSGEELLCLIDKDTDVPLLIKGMVKNDLLDREYLKALVTYILYKHPENLDTLSSLPIEYLGQLLYFHKGFLKKFNIVSEITEMLTEKIKNKINNIRAEGNMILINTENYDLRDILENPKVTGGLITPRDMKVDDVGKIFNISNITIGMMGYAYETTVLYMSCNTTVKALKKYVIIEDEQKDARVNLKVAFKLTTRGNLVANSTLYDFTGYKKSEKAIDRFFGRMKPCIISGRSIDEVLDQLEQKFPKKGA
jgi:hypothetical protein